MTLDDLERPKRTLVENKSYYGAHHKNLNEDRPILSVAKCSLMVLVSRYIRIVQIFAGVPQMGCAEWQWGSRKRRYSDFCFEISGSNTQIFYTVIHSPSSVFRWSQNAWPWMTSKRDSRCFVLALVLDAFASTSLPCLAYINVPFHYRLILKFDRYRNLQRHRTVLLR